MSQNNWTEEHIKDKVSKCDVFWLAGPDKQFEMIREHDIIFNQLPGIGVASNKRKFAQIMNTIQKHHPEEFDFVPRTFTMPEDAQILLDFMKKHPTKTFICKPSDGSEGCGILLA